MFQRGYGGLRWSENHQKHAQSTYLDEYLWFKKNLAEKFLLENFLEHFGDQQPSRKIKTNHWRWPQRNEEHLI